MIKTNQINFLKKNYNGSSSQKFSKEISQLRCSQQSSRVRCCYINPTTQTQIVRIDNVASGFLERVVLPHKKIIFEASPDDYLEVHTGNPISSILSDKILCHRLIYREFYPP
ncbi:DUF1830 domain-containing protein (plasmid) [Acaryochloris sp. CCMEE 5410]|nr:DUF1830 domain-containing protein [Acaryochloris sp. CCMEE 5410]